LLAAVAPLASAHYTFDVLIVDGQETRANQYIRQNTRAEKYMPTKFKNSFDGVTPLTNDFRCNLGAGTAGRTEVIEVAPGTKLGAKLAFGATMRHPGPALVYMSRAPGDDVRSYDGSGDWFKIFQEGICRDTDVTTDAWCTWDRNSVDATIPEGTPAGEYLVRFEHVGLHGAHDGQAEFYYSCAQIRVTGNGSGTPGPMVKFPGAYGVQDESWNFSVWGNNHNFPFPQPAVWEG
ncbi:glycoside hydrolase, partial [Stachybotrys elegans]